MRRNLRSADGGLGVVGSREQPVVFLAPGGCVYTCACPFPSAVGATKKLSSLPTLLRDDPEALLA